MKLSSMLKNATFLSQVEIQFQSGHYDKCVSKLREKYKDDMAELLNHIFSHSQVLAKNKLVGVCLFDACIL